MSDTPTSTMVYKYRLLPPTQNAEALEELFYKAHQYYQDLIANERRRREEWFRRAAEIDPEIQALYEARKDAQDALRDLRRAKVTEGVHELTTKLDDLSSQIGKLLRQHKDREDLKETDREAQKRQKELEQALRRGGTRPSMYGMKGCVRMAFAKACKAPKAKGPRPKFRQTPWGLLEEQIPGGMTVEQLFEANHPGVRAIKVPQEEWPTGHRPGSRRSKRTVANLLFRLDNATTRDDTKRVWAKFLMVMHRPLPPGAKILRVLIKRRALGETPIRVKGEVFSEKPFWLWEACFVVTVPAALPRRRGNIVAVDIGYRVLDDGIRVAVAYDGIGYKELRVPLSYREERARISQLRDQRSQGTVRVRDEIRWFLEEYAPQWWEQIAGERTPTPFRKLYYTWRENRLEVEGEQEVLEKLKAWLDEDRKLWGKADYFAYKLNQRRLKLFEGWAVKILRDAKTLVLEDFDLRAFTTAKRDPGRKGTNQRKSMRDAAPGELRTILERTASRDGIEVVRESPEYSTRDCSWCRYRNEFEEPEELVQTCTGCNKEWDQDRNACRNLWHWDERREWKAA